MRLGSYSGGMEFTTFLLWKAGLLVLAAFIWGIFCGITNRPLGRARRDNLPAQSNQNADQITSR